MNGKYTEREIEAAKKLLFEMIDELNSNKSKKRGERFHTETFGGRTRQILRPTRADVARFGGYENWAKAHGHTFQMNGGQCGCQYITEFGPDHLSIGEHHNIGSPMTPPFGYIDDDYSPISCGTFNPHFGGDCGTISMMGSC